MAVAAGAMAISSPDWPRAAMIVLCAAFGGTAIGWNGVYLAEVAREAPAGKTVEATGGALFFTFFGVLITPAAVRRDRRGRRQLRHGLRRGRRPAAAVRPVVAGARGPARAAQCNECLTGDTDDRPFLPVRSGQPARALRQGVRRRRRRDARRPRGRRGARRQAGRARRPCGPGSILRRTCTCASTAPTPTGSRTTSRCCRCRACAA